MRRIFKGPIARSTVNTTGVLLLRLAFQVITLLVVTRMLGSAQFGAYAASAALAILCGSLGTFGTHLILLGEASKDASTRGAILSYALPTTLIVGSILFIPYATLALLLIRHTGISVWVVLALGVAELLLQPLIVLATVEHQAHGRIARSQLLIIMPLGLRMLAAVAVWRIGLNHALVAFAFAYLLAAGLGLAVAARTLPLAWPRMRDWRLARLSELQQSAGYGVLALTALAPGELDKTLAMKLLPLHIAGVYAAGTRVINALTVPVMALLISSTPRLFRENAASAPRATRPSRLFPLLFSLALAYGLLASILLRETASLIALAFGVGYRDLAQVLPWLALAVPAVTLRIAAGAILVTQSRPWIRAGFEVSGIAVLAISAMALAPGRPIAGMPLALACAEWMMAIVGWGLVWRGNQT